MKIDDLIKKKKYKRCGYEPPICSKRYDQSQWSHNAKQVGPLEGKNLANLCHQAEVTNTRQTSASRQRLPTPGRPLPAGRSYQCQGDLCHQRLPAPRRALPAGRLPTLGRPLPSGSGYQHQGELCHQRLPTPGRPLPPKVTNTKVSFASRQVTNTRSTPLPPKVTNTKESSASRQVTNTRQTFFHKAEVTLGRPLPPEVIHHGDPCHQA